MSTKEYPECIVDEESIEAMFGHLIEFMKPYLPMFGRSENHGHANMYVAGRLQRMDRRTLEPIATEHGVHRRPLQYFVGSGPWADTPVLNKINEQAAREIGTRDGVLIMDASGFAEMGYGAQLNQQVLLG